MARFATINTAPLPPTAIPLCLREAGAADLHRLRIIRRWRGVHQGGKRFDLVKGVDLISSPLTEPIIQADRLGYEGLKIFRNLSSS